jgi:hypothetical protein
VPIGLSDLPAEIIEVIISYAAADRLQPRTDELCRLARVSKAFNKLVEPLLYTSLTVNSTETFYNLHLQLMKADRKRRAHVRELHLCDIDSKWTRSWWGMNEVNFLRGFVLDVLDGCPNLARLAITGGDISTGPSFFRDNFHLHPGHRHITHLCICNIGGDVQATPGLVALICKWPALRILELPQFTGEPRWRQAYHLDRQVRPSSPADVSSVLPNHSSNIQALHFRSPQGLDNLSLTAMLLMPRKLEHLSLCAAFWPEVLEELFEVIGKGLVSLRLNTSRYLGHLFDDSITVALGKCTSLKFLHLDNSLFRDEHVAVLPATLQYLTLTWLDPNKCTLEPLRDAISDMLCFPNLRSLEVNRLQPFDPAIVEGLKLACESARVEASGHLFDTSAETPERDSEDLYGETPLFTGASFAHGVVLD